ncbi:MAG TPA: glycosyltransferase family 9 protein, partial [bacterium]
EVAGLACIERNTIEDYSGFLKREGLLNLSKSVPKANGKKPLVHFHPGCGSYGWQRAWPLEYYVALAIKLKKELGASIRLTGMGAYEEDLVEKIQALAGFEMENRCGQLELPELAALVDQADLVVCGNTGIMHIAAGLGKAMVVPNGPANPIKWGPAASYGFIEMKAPNLVTAIGVKKANIRVIQASLPCSPCTTLGYEYGCPIRPCMESIGVDIVYRECLNLLKMAS